MTHLTPRFCPVLKEVISDGKCYDIIHVTVIPEVDASILPGLTINQLKSALHTCPICEHFEEQVEESEIEWGKRLWKTYPPDWMKEE